MPTRVASLSEDEALDHARTERSRLMAIWRRRFLSGASTRDVIALCPIRLDDSL